MDESSPLPRVSGDNSGALTPTNGPLKRSFDDLGTDDAVSSDGSGSSAQASNNGDSERNKRARSRSPPPPDVSEASRSITPSSFVESTQLRPTMSSVRSTPSPAPRDPSVVLIDPALLPLPPQVSNVAPESPAPEFSSISIEVQVSEPPTPHSRPPSPIPIPINQNTSHTTPFASPESMTSSATMGRTPSRPNAESRGAATSEAPSGTTPRTAMENFLDRARAFQASVEAIRTTATELSTGVSTPGASRSTASVREAPSQPPAFGLGNATSTVITIDPYSLERAVLLESPPLSPLAPEGNTEGQGPTLRQIDSQLRTSAMASHARERTRASRLTAPGSSEVAPASSSSRRPQPRNISSLDDMVRPRTTGAAELRRRALEIAAGLSEDLAPRREGLDSRSPAYAPLRGPAMTPSATAAASRNQASSSNTWSTGVSVGPGTPHLSSRRDAGDGLQENQPGSRQLPHVPSTTFRTTNLNPNNNAPGASLRSRPTRTLPTRAEPSIRMSIDIPPLTSPTGSDSSLGDEWDWYSTSDARLGLEQSRDDYRRAARQTRDARDRYAHWAESSMLAPSLSSPYPASAEPAPLPSTTFPPALGPIHHRHIPHEPRSSTPLASADPSRQSSNNSSQRPPSRTAPVSQNSYNPPSRRLPPFPPPPMFDSPYRSAFHTNATSPSHDESFASAFHSVNSAYGSSSRDDDTRRVGESSTGADIQSELPALLNLNESGNEDSLPTDWHTLLRDAERHADLHAAYDDDGWFDEIIRQSSSIRVTPRHPLPPLASAMDWRSQRSQPSASARRPDPPSSPPPLELRSGLRAGISSLTAQRSGMADLEASLEQLRRQQEVPPLSMGSRTSLTSAPRMTPRALERSGNSSPWGRQSPHLPPSLDRLRRDLNGLGYAEQGSLGLSPTSMAHRVDLQIPEQSRPSTSASQPISSRWQRPPTSSLSGGTTADRTPETPAPTAQEIEQELRRLSAIMQEARESARSLMRYADRLVNASGPPPTTSQPPTRDLPYNYLESDAERYPWDGTEGMWLARPPSGLLDVPSSGDHDRETVRLRERRRLRSLAENVTQAATGVDRIIGYMGREGRAEQLNRTSRSTEDAVGAQRPTLSSINTTANRPRDASTTARPLGSFASSTETVPPSYPRPFASSLDAHGPYSPDVVSPASSQVTPVDAFGHLRSGSSFEAAAARWRQRHNGELQSSSQPTGSSFEAATARFRQRRNGELPLASQETTAEGAVARARTMRLQHRQRLAPAYSRESLLEPPAQTRSASRSGALRSRLDAEERPLNMPFHAVFAAHRHREAANRDRDYVNDSAWDSSYESLLRLSARIGEARPHHTPAEILASLRRGVFRDFPNPTNETRCPICLDDYTQTDNVLAMHPCAHFFHADCLQQWLQTSRSCPNCRARVELRTEGGAAPNPQAPAAARVASPRPTFSMPPYPYPLARLRDQAQAILGRDAPGRAGSPMQITPDRRSPIPPLPPSAHASQTSSPAGSIMSFTHGSGFFGSHMSTPSTPGIELHPDDPLRLHLGSRPPSPDSEMEEDSQDARRGRQA